MKRYWAEGSSLQQGLEQLQNHTQRAVNILTSNSLEDVGTALDGQTNEIDQSKRNFVKGAAAALGSGAFSACLEEGQGAGPATQANQTGTPAGPSPTPQRHSTPEGTPEGTPRQTDQTGTRRQTTTDGSQVIRPSESEVDVDEIYRQSITERDIRQISDGELTFDLDTSEPVTEQIKEAALRGVKKGNLTGGINTDINATTHYAAAKAVEQSVDHDVDAVVHEAFFGGNLPAVVFEYENEQGERQADFLNAQDISEEYTHEEVNWYTENWTENTRYWADTSGGFHPLDFSNLTTESIDGGKNFPDKMKDPLQEMLNALPTNSYELDVNIRFGSAEAWKEAGRMVSEKSYREFTDLVDSYANSQHIDNLELRTGDEHRLVGANVSDENYQGPLESIHYEQ